SGLNLGGLIATSAVVTAVIGFSLQDTLGNVMAGLALQLDGVLEVGHWIKIADTSGVVREIKWRSTLVETRNRERVVIPNSVLVKGQFAIVGTEGKPSRWRRWVYFNVDFRFTPSDVISAVTEALCAAPIEHAAADPVPQCILLELGDSFCRYAVRYWLANP